MKAIEPKLDLSRVSSCDGARQADRLALDELYLCDKHHRGMEYQVHRHDVKTPAPGKGGHLTLEAYDYRPEKELCSSPLVMIHGAGHGAIHFRAFLAPYLAEQGIRCIAFSARGHGQSDHPGVLHFKLSTLRTHARDALAVLSHFSLLNKAPIILGHSMGGAVTQQLLEGGFDVRAGILLASVPHTGTLASTVRFAQKHPLRFLKINGTLSLRSLYDTPEHARESLFSQDRPLSEITPMVRHMTDYFYGAYFQTLRRDFVDTERIRSRGIPIFMAGGEKDSLFTVAEQQEHALALGVDREFHLLKNTAHDVMIEPSAPELADAVVSFLRRHGMMKKA